MLVMVSLPPAALRVHAVSDPACCVVIILNVRTVVNQLGTIFPVIRLAMETVFALDPVVFTERL